MTMILRVENVSLGFQQPPLMTSLDFTLARGDRLGLCGRSGLGKTTLVRAVARASAAQAPRHVLAGKIAASAQKTGYAPQARSLPRWYKVSRQLDLAMDNAVGQRRAKLLALGQVFGLDALLDRFPHELSGGETQRVSVFLALALADDFLILDEPFTAIDLATKAKLLRATLDYIEDQKIAVLCISHDVDLLIYLNTSVKVLAENGVQRTIEVPDHLHESYEWVGKEAARSLRALILDAAVN